MNPEDKEQLELCLSGGESILALPAKDIVDAYDVWQQKTRDAVGLASKTDCAC